MQASRAIPYPHTTTDHLTRLATGCYVPPRPPYLSPVAGIVSDTVSYLSSTPVHPPGEIVYVEGAGDLTRSSEAVERTARAPLSAKQVSEQTYQAGIGNVALYQLSSDYITTASRVGGLIHTGGFFAAQALTQTAVQTARDRVEAIAGIDYDEHPVLQECADLVATTVAVTTGAGLYAAAAHGAARAAAVFSTPNVAAILQVNAGIRAGAVVMAVLDETMKSRRQKKDDAYQQIPWQQRQHLSGD